MAKRGRQSLRKKMVAIWIYVFVAIIGVSIFYGVYIFNLTVKSANKAIQDSNRYFISGINRDIADMIKTTNSIYHNNEEFRKLAWFTLDEFGWMKAAYGLSSYFDMKVQAVNCPVGMFFYDENKKTLRSNYSYSMNIYNKFEMDEALRDYIEVNDDQRQNMGHFDVDDNTYFCYLLSNNGICVGFLFNLASYIDDSDGKQILYLWDDGKTIVDSGDDIVKLSEDGTWTKPEDHFWNKNKINISEGEIADTPLSIVIIQKMVSYRKVMMQPAIVCTVIFIPVVLLILIFYILHIFNQTLLHPVELLVEHVKQLETGENSTRPDTGDGESIDEYAELDEKIENLLGNIEDLREQKYQEEQKADWARLQYYKLQINPHFYLNCLNTISMLIDRNNLMAANGMIRDLSSHFRYVFQDQKEFVSFGEELSEVRALCNIYSLRAGIPILLDEEVESEYRNIRIPPLMLQTFVENSIKHRDASGKVLNIKIRHERYNDRTKIYVMDNGSGYSEKDLEEYNKPVEEFIYHSDHVGIDNFKFRMKLLYKDKASFSFYNNPDGGAVSEITIWEVFDEYNHN